MNRKKSFTLIEILISAAIFAGLSAAMYGLLSSGLKTRKFLSDQVQSKAKVLISLDKMRQELVNSCLLFSGNISVNFIGHDQQISFFTIIKNYQKDIPQTALVNYFFSDQAVYRTVSDPFNPQFLSKTVFIDQVKQCEFSYYDLAQKQWLSSWPSTVKPPVGIKISIIKTNSLTPIEKYVFIDQ